jgi:predicted ArsR family transcriptional regulator
LYVDWIEAVADPVRLRILRSLSSVPDATAADLVSSGSVSSQTLRRHLDALVALGVIHMQPGASDGQTPGRPATRFSLAAGMRERVVRLIASFSQL